MKRFLIFLSLLFLTSCGIYKKIPVYQKSYYGEEEKATAINDVYWWLDAYNFDSIPFEDWLTFQEYVEGGYMIERVFQKKWDEKTEFVINFTTCVCDSLSYHIYVLERTKDRRLIKP